MQCHGARRPSSEQAPPDQLRHGTEAADRSPPPRASPALDRVVPATSLPPSPCRCLHFLCNEKRHVCQAPASPVPARVRRAPRPARIDHASRSPPGLTGIHPRRRPPPPCSCCCLCSFRGRAPSLTASSIRPCLPRQDPASCRPALASPPAGPRPMVRNPPPPVPVGPTPVSDRSLFFSWTDLANFQGIADLQKTP